MKFPRKFLAAFLAVMVITSLSSTNIFAADKSGTVSNSGNVDSTVQPQTHWVPQWKVDSTSYYTYSYGAWRNGPSGKGPSTLTISDSDTYNFQVTNTISGSYGNLKVIEASLGVTIGRAITHSDSYSHEVPAGKRQQIIYRPGFEVHKVVESKYTQFGKKLETRTSYVYIFDSWDFSYKNL